MQLIDAGEIGTDHGLTGDHKGLKFPRRQITVLAIEDWTAALAELTDLAGPVALAWTARRANLLVEGVELPKARGGIFRVGAIELEVTYQTVPCRRMDEIHSGLLKALSPDWRGGVTCIVRYGGLVQLGDPVSVVFAPKRHTVRLPG